VFVGYVCVLTLVWEMLVMVGLNILEWDFKTQVSYTTWMGLAFVMKSWDANIKYQLDSLYSKMCSWDTNYHVQGLLITSNLCIFP